MIIQPYDLKQISIETLLNDKKIVNSKDNKSWSSTIFPKSTKLNNIHNFDKDHIITIIDDELFDDFIILNNVTQTIYFDNNTKRDFIQCVEIGDYNDSVKRYNNLNIPIDYNTDAQSFLNLPKQDFTQNNNLNIKTELIYESEIDILMKQTKQNNIFDNNINHPHINQFNQSANITKANNKNIIIQIFKWAKDKGVKYIYCINEHRPNIINNQYLTSFVYYTIKGAYENSKNTTFNSGGGSNNATLINVNNIIDENLSIIVDENGINIIY